MVKNVIYPTVSLFLYDIRVLIDDKDTQYTISANRQNFWKKCGVGIPPQLDAPDSYGKLKDIDLEGRDGLRELYFFDDVYALFLEDSGSLLASGNVEEPSPKHYSAYQEIKESILQSGLPSNQTTTVNGTLGQTWLLYGQVIDPAIDLKEAAMEIYKHAFPERSNLSFRESRNIKRNIALFESSIKIDEEQHEHIVVVVFKGSLSLGDFKKCLLEIRYPLLRLFLYRHKMIWANQKFRYMGDELKKIQKR